MNLAEIADRIRQHPRLVIADDYEIAIHETCRKGVHFFNGEQRNTTVERRLWVGLRIFHRKRSGRSTTEDFSDASIDALVNHAFQSAEYSTVDPWFRFPLWRQPKPIYEKKFELTQEFTPLFPQIQTPPAEVQETYTDECARVWIGRKTERLILSDCVATTRIRWAVGPNGFTESRAMAREEYTPQLRDRWFEQLLTSYFAFDGADLYLDVGEKDVVLGPKVVAEILERMAPSFCADPAQATPSPFLFSEKVRLTDRATLAGNFAFDMEGVLSQETTLVDNGVQKGFLHDTQTAARANRASTGSLKLFGDDTLPRIRPSHLHLTSLGTSKPVPELLAQLGDGVCLLEVEAWVDGSKPHEALLLLAGWRVAGAQCVEPIRRAPMRIDLRTLFQKVSAIGSDEARFDGCTVPSILLEKMPLSS